MAERDLDKTILIVVGVGLRAEEKDRALAYRLAGELDQRLEAMPEASGWGTLVISDVLYLNTSRLTACPALSVGGPGVNKLSAILFDELPSIVAVDHTLLIQMDVAMSDHRCCIWGMDHALTVEALELFLSRGHADQYLRGVISGHSEG